MASESIAERWRTTGLAEGNQLANWFFLQWMLLRRVAAGHTPFRMTGVMAVTNIVVGVGGFYFFTVLIGNGSARTASVYALYGGAIGFMAVGVAMNQLLTVGMAAIAHAILDERSQGTLAYWVTTGRGMVSLVLRASFGEFAIACVNSVVTFVILVTLFPVHFEVNLLSFAVVLVVSMVAVGGVGLAAAGLFVGGYTGQNPIMWAWGLTTTFVAGVFVPLSAFNNPFIQFLSEVMPSTHALLAMRSAVLRDAPLGDGLLLSQLIPWALFAAVMAAVGVWVFESGLRRAFRNGKLIQT